MGKLGILRCIAHKDWGGDRETTLRIHRALIRSKFDYGSVIYAAAKDRLLKTLDPVHNEALRICTGAFKSPPVISLYAETGEPSLANRRKQLTLQFFLLPESPPPLMCLHTK